MKTNNKLLAVTGYKERSHPATRKLARVCIELGRMRRAAKAQQPKATDNKPKPKPENTA